MRETTHKMIDGYMVQIVSPERLREILDEDGDSYDPPDYFIEDDQWDVEVTP